LSSWVISAGTGITLPFGPNQTRITGPAKVETFQQEGDDPILIVDGLDAFTLELQGVLYDCWDTVIEPLLGLRGKEVALTTPDGDLDDTYVLVGFEPSRIGALPRWTYTMRLQKGSSHVIL
jgi:hypothetical protein